MANIDGDAVMAKVTKLEPKNAVQRLVDELGEVSEQRKLLDKREKEIKNIIYTYGPGAYVGKTYDALCRATQTTSYKTELLITHVTPSILEKCKVVTPYLKIEVTRKST
jgi:hypothetical protein